MSATHNCKALYDVKVRLENHTNNVSSEKLLAGEAFQISEILPDKLDPTNTAKKWGRIYGGRFHNKFTALEYPGNPVPISTYTPITSTPDPEPSPTIPDVAITADTKLATVTIHSNIPMEIYYNGDKIR